VLDSSTPTVSEEIESQATYAFSAFPDKTAEAVEVVSEAHEIAIRVIVAGEFRFGIERSRYRDAYERWLRRMPD
jgi:hypothetical protein